MTRQRFNKRGIAEVLRERENGALIEDLCRKHGISQRTFYRWRAKCRYLDTEDSDSCKALVDENQRLKKLLAESMLDLAVLRGLPDRK
jgi:putative transposase